MEGTSISQLKQLHDRTDLVISNKIFGRPDCQKKYNQIIEVRNMYQTQF